MTRGKRRHGKRSPIWAWISFFVFGFLIILFGTSIWKKKSPAKVIKTWFARTPSTDPLAEMTKKELIVHSNRQKSSLNSLQEQLDACQDKQSGIEAIINTKTNSLNMRSGPSLNSKVMIKIPNGSQVNILYYDETEFHLDGATGFWCRIRYENQEGWVWGNYLETDAIN